MFKFQRKISSKDVLAFTTQLSTALRAGLPMMRGLELIREQQHKPGAKDLRITDGVLRFENVEFRYPAWADDRRTLDRINLEARPGKTIGIVGPPGSGKSTIAHLIGRYYDVTGGRITIDGQDIRDVRLSSLRQAVEIDPRQPDTIPSTKGTLQG